MGKRANPIVIGGFVVGAIALAVMGVIVFGSGRFFADTTPFVMHFTGSVDGLNVGSPVKFKGVEIGAVTDILLDLGEEARIPVWVEIDNRKIVARGAAGWPRSREKLKEAIERGLRAQLNSQSLVTGLLFVQLDYHPETPVVLISPPEEGLNEIPTIPTTLEQAQQAAAELIARLKEFDFEGFGKSLRASLDGFDRAINSPGLQEAIAKLPATLGSLDETMKSVRDLAGHLDERTGPLLKSVQEASDRSAKAIDQARATMQSVQNLADTSSPLAGQLGAVLAELRGTARSIRLLADYLERNPAALLRGREVTEP